MLLGEGSEDLGFLLLGAEAHRSINQFVNGTMQDLCCSSLQRDCNRLLNSEDLAVGNGFAVISLLFLIHFLGAFSFLLAKKIRWLVEEGGILRLIPFWGKGV